jgi:hypothetical protein
MHPQQTTLITEPLQWNHRFLAQVVQHIARLGYGGAEWRDRTAYPVGGSWPDSTPSVRLAGSE